MLHKKIISVDVSCKFLIDGQNDLKTNEKLFLFEGCHMKLPKNIMIS